MYKAVVSFIIASLSGVLVTAQSYYNVKTLAGDTAGYLNGAFSKALFSSPTGIVADTNSKCLYVTDTYNNVVRKIWLSKDSVSTLAGNDTAGFRDGDTTKAEFNNPTGICVDKLGNVYVADMYNNRIRKITPAGIVSTYGGNGTAGYVNGPADSAEFYLPTGVAIDTLGNLYVADDGNSSVREISSSGTVTTLAGMGYSGWKNGNGDTALFNGLFGITVNDSGTVFVSEYVNNDIRRIKNGVVSVYSGLDTMASPAGYRGGLNDTALFSAPMGLVTDSIGELLICDEYNYRIRIIRGDTTYLFAGAGYPGYLDTIVPFALFNNPTGITRIRNTFYVADNANNRIRALLPPPPLGIAPVTDNKIEGLIAYPNPCNNRLIISSAPSGIAEMLDVTGRQVWSSAQFKAPYILSTEGMSAGVYFLRISNNKGSFTRKIVIER